jgi:predicted Rossmann fold flavoprotein
MRIAIIGAGAAGFFLAINLKKMLPESEITIFEKSKRVLAKVEISGGGRCNVTNSFDGIKDLKYAYPRGEKLMKRLFKVFSHKDAYRWFVENGVELVTQEDNCVFPKSQDSHSIINCFLSQASVMKINIMKECKVSIENNNDKTAESPITLHISTSTGKEDTITYDAVAITTGGSPRREGLEWIERLGHKIVQPVPSLFTFNIRCQQLRNLMGTVVENAIASIPSTKFRSQDPLLITHWGMSGPAILKLSSYSARHLYDNNYKSELSINWTGIINYEQTTEELTRIIEENPGKKISSIRPYNLPSRLWNYLIERTLIDENKRWNELGKKNINKLVNTLVNDIYHIEGRSAFKEEFVTCGGVSLESVNSNTLESKSVPNLYFAGEVLDIDAITGGFNFQAAWTTAYTVAKAIKEKNEER